MRRKIIRRNNLNAATKSAPVAAPIPAPAPTLPWVAAAMPAPTALPNIPYPVALTAMLR